jgi:uncharacterized Fe-S cluster-containing radical SAM superfamily protein
MQGLIIFTIKNPVNPFPYFTGLSYASCLTILKKKLKFHPYKFSGSNPCIPQTFSLKIIMRARPVAFMNIETVGHLIKYGKLLFILFLVVLYVSCFKTTNPRHYQPVTPKFFDIHNLQRVPTLTHKKFSYFGNILLSFAANSFSPC